MQVRRPQIDQLLYDYTPTTGGPVTLRQDQVLHFRGLSGDGLIGYSPIRLAKETIGLAMAAEKFGAKFFSGGTTTKVVIKHPGKLSPSAKQNIGLGWQEANAGLDQMHRASVLDEGMDLIKIGVDPESAQMLATRQFQVKEIARIFNIPLHMLAEQEKASYASMEQEMLRFVQHTLRPWLVRIEQEINLKLLSPAERRVYFVEHLVDGLLRADLRSRYEAHYKGIMGGFLSRNEAREKENLPWRPEAEDLWQPVNIMDAGQTPLQPPGAGTITEPGANQ
jgi:HK97 family phage portal protein